MKQANKSAWEPKPIHTIEDLRAQLDAIEVAHRDGRLSTEGGWSVGQNLEHCGKFMRDSFDGFTMKVPAPLRMMGRLFIKRMLTKPGAQMKPGYKIPKMGRSLMPEEEAGVEAGLALMSQQVARLEAGEKMTQMSPFLGKMTPEQWVNLHLNHCRMHFGFIQTGEA